jgi:hypothetical protein
MSIQPFDVIQEVCAKRGIAANRVIWFEHGPSAAGSSVGCGVDHAHLHMIIDAPFSFRDFASNAAESGQITWQDKPTKIAHQLVEPHTSYLIRLTGADLP